MIGGVVTSAILELLIYPVIFVLWRQRELGDQTEEEAPLIQPALIPSGRTRQRLPKAIALIVAIAVILYGGKLAVQNLSSTFGKATQTQGAPFVTQSIDSLTAKLYGELRSGLSEVMITFNDANGRAVDVGNVKFDLDMNMPGMHMHQTATVQRARTAGQYRAKIKPGMAGDWIAKLSFEGPRGSAQTTFSANVK